MKKAMFLIMFALMAMITTSVLGAIDPIVTEQPTGHTYREAQCYSYNSELYCVAGYYDSSYAVRLFNYDPDLNTFNVVKNPITTLSRTIYGQYTDCIPYGTKTYCLGQTQSFAFDADTGDNVITLTNDPVAQATSFTSCDLRPGTDEIYCAYTTAIVTVSKYDIGTDTWTYLAELDYSEFTWPAEDVACAFVGDDDFYCVGGGDGGSELFDVIKKYTISTNTTTTIQAAFPTIFGNVINYGGVLYYFGGFDWYYDENLPVWMGFYNPDTEVVGNLTAAPVSNFIPGKTECVGDNPYYCMSGYTNMPAWDPSDVVVTITFPVSCSGNDNCVEPTIDTTVTGLTEGYHACDYYSGDGLLYCVGDSYGLKQHPIYTLDPETGDRVDISITPEAFNCPACGGGCSLYNDELYCMLRNRASSPWMSVFKYDILGNTTTILSNSMEGTDLPQADIGCELRPGTDEIWCNGQISGLNYGVYYYDISEDTWHSVSVIVPPSPDDYYSEGTFCTWRDSNEYYCYGGCADVNCPTSTFMKYQVDTNSTRFYSGTVAMVGGFCRYHNDIMYCYAAEDWNNGGLEDMVYYDPRDDTVGTLTTVLPNGGYGAWYGCSEVDTYSDYCFGVFDSTYGDVTWIDHITWEIPCSPSWDCSEYSDQCINFETECVGVTDANACGQSYTGNYSEFEPELCGVSSGSTGAAHQQIITPKQTEESEEGAPAFSIVGGEKFNLWKFIDSIIFWIREKVGLQ